MTERREVSNEDFMTALDRQSPRWVTEFADQQDLVQLCQSRVSMDELRRRVARKLGLAVRAYVEADAVLNPPQP